MDSAADRRARMQVRVFPSLAAQQKDDGAYWAVLPVATRVLGV